MICKKRKGRNSMSCKGLLIVISAPSGTGKSSLMELLQKEDSNIKMSVSATTRNQRDGEKEGENYFFKSDDEFEGMIKKDEFVEWVRYCDNYYGTPAKYIEDMLQKGYTVVLEIDVEGAANIVKKYPESVLIFVLPPSFKELERRIKKRGSESSEVLQKRLKKAESEILHYKTFDYVVINDKLETALVDINSIIKAERLKIDRNLDILEKIGGWTV
jgi:guanylate kinase